MKKTSLKENIQIINKLGNRVPKSINEAINFEGFEDDNEMGVEDEPMEEPMDVQHNDNPINDDGIDVENFISNMRKSSLKILAKLADDPDSQTYIFAKKIFQMADKAHEDEKEGKDINGQPKNSPMGRDV